MSISPLTPTVPVTPPAKKPVAITGPLSIGDLLDRVFRFLRARFGILVLTAGIVLVPIGLVSALLTGQFMTGYLELIQFSTSTTEISDSQLMDLFGDVAGFMGGILVVTALTTIGTSVISLATTYHVERFLHGTPSTLGEGMQAAFRRFLAMLGMQLAQAVVIGAATLLVMLLLGIVFFGAIFVFGMIGAVAVESGTSDTTNVILMILLVVGVVIAYVVFLVLALAPAAYLAARWVAAAPAIILENLGPIAALKRSWGLTKGHIWRCIGYVVLLTLFSSLVIGLPLSTAQQFAMMFMPSRFALIAILGTVAGYLASILYQPIYASGVAMLYYDLRVRGEAYDVALRVAELEAEVAQDAPAA
jgi:hypothetical protein